MISQPQRPPEIIEVYCGELCNTNQCNSKVLNLLNRNFDNIEPNITIAFDKFIRNPENLPSRILDLLHIASYVYCADRMVFRGKRDSLGKR